LLDHLSLYEIFDKSNRFKKEYVEALPSRL